MASNLFIPVSLIQACLKQDRKCQRELFELLLPYVKGVVYRYLNDAQAFDDVVQETFMRMFRSLEQFNEERGAFKSWTARIAINLCFEQNKKLKRQREELQHVELPLTVPADAALNFYAEEILSLIQRLPVDQREVFMLAAVEGFSHAEIAELLQIEESTSRKRLSRARETLKANLGWNASQETKTEKVNYDKF